jgi:tetratricopeptide (TPR) repeat protein
MVLAVLIASGLLVAALRGGSYAVIPRTQDAIAIWWVIGLSVAFGLLPRHRWSVEVRLAVAGLLGLAAWTALGLLWSDSAERTLEEALRVLSYAGLVMLVAWAFGARDRTRVVVVLTVVAGVVCLLALLSRVAPELLGTQRTSGSYDTTRLAYPFNYWNAVGCWGAMTLALALPLSAHAPPRWVRAVALCIASLAPVVVYLTYSRTAALGIVLVVVLVVALSPQRWFVAANALIAGVGATAAVLAIRGAPEIARGNGTAGRASVLLVLGLVWLLTVALAVLGPHERLRRVRTPLRAARIALAASLAAILVVAILAGPRAWDSFQRGSEPAGSDPAERLASLSGTRRLLWSAALDSFAERPLAGIGAGTFEFAWNRDPHRSGHVLDAHSLYLESLAELGIPGALMVIAALAALLTGGLRSVRRQTDDTARAVAAGCAVAFVVFCVTAGVDWMWESTAVACLALVAGTLAAASPGLPLPRPRWPLRVRVAIPAAVAIVVQLPVLVAATEISTSQRAAGHGRLVDALSSATAAAEAEPWSATAQLQRALVLEQLGQLQWAAAAAAKATRLEPVNWQPWLVRGRIEAERGNVVQALAHVRRARALNPRAPIFQPGVARALAGPVRSP